MSKLGFVPQLFSKLNRQHLPMWAIAINFTLGMLAFLPLPQWQSMVSFFVSAMVITYAMGPISLLCFRYSLPNQKRLFRLPAAHFLCLLAFYCCNLFSYWTGWQTISKLGIALVIGLSVFTISCLRGKVKLTSHELKSIGWVIPYLCGLIIISYLGAFGGKNMIPFGWDFLVIALFSVAILYTAVQCRIPLHTEDIHTHLYSESAMLNTAFNH